MSTTKDGLVKEGKEAGHRLYEALKDLGRLTSAYGVEHAPEYAQLIGVQKTFLNHAVQQAMKSGTTVSTRRKADPVKRSAAG